MKGRFETSTGRATLELGMQFGRGLKPGDVVGLRGDLGAGKTQFAKGVIHQRTGVAVEEIPSPTFTLVEEYDGNPRLYHVDLYRLDKKSEILELPWDDMMGTEAITLIEWSERLPPEISRCNIEVFLSKSKDHERVVEIQQRKPHDRE